MWHIFFIMWISWSWKGTLIKNLKQIKNNNFYFPLSYKTRQIRVNEMNWVDANFITKEDFFYWVQKWEFLEYAVLYDWEDYYWTKYEDVIEKWINEWKVVIKELDINWLEKLRKEKPELDEKYTTIFLNIPTETLKQRIKKRWAFMSDEELNRRINTAIIEEEKAKKLCDYMIDANLSEDVILEEFLRIVREKVNL